MDDTNVIVLGLPHSEITKTKWRGLQNKPFHTVTIHNQVGHEHAKYLFFGTKTLANEEREQHWLHFLIKSKLFRVISYQHDSNAFICVRHKPKVTYE